MDIKSRARDVKAEEEGTWVEMDDGWSVKLRSFNSKVVRKLEQKQLEKNRRFYRSNKLVPLDIAEGDLLEIVCDGLVLDWRGLTDGSKSIKWTPDIGRKILGDPQYRGMLDDIIGAARDQSVWSAQDREEDLGNSPTP